MTIAVSDWQGLGPTGFLVKPEARIFFFDRQLVLLLFVRAVHWWRFIMRVDGSLIPFSL